MRPDLIAARRLPPDLRDRLTADEAVSWLKRNAAPLYEEHERARLERVLVEGNRKLRQAAAVELRKLGRDADLPAVGSFG